MTRFAKVLAVSGAMAMLACGGSSDGSPAAGGGGDAGHQPVVQPFSIFPKTIYTGFDGMHAYKAPVIAVSTMGEPIETGGVTWTLADPSFGELKVESGGVMITAKKAGSTMLTATQGDKTANATLTVYAYTPAAYAEGEQRYKNPVDMNNPACTNCHGKGAGKGPDHTPTELDADPDSEVQNTFTSGVDPENRPIAEESEWAYLLEGKKHMWSVTATQKSSLLAYLRALEPTGYPEYDAPTDEK
jgi:mono/diheme cytochrome c family protein